MTRLGYSSWFIGFFLVLKVRELVPSSVETNSYESTADPQCHAVHEGQAGPQGHADLEGHAGPHGHADIEGYVGSQGHVDLEGHVGSQGHADIEGYVGSQGHADLEGHKRHCPKRESHETQKYTRELNNRNPDWDLIIYELKKAELLYEVEEKVGLVVGDCWIYEDLIRKDLAQFIHGITKLSIDAASSRGVLYQIIEGKLYRDKICKFPARCSGVEHFLQKVSKELPNLEFVLNPSDWPVVSNHFPDPLPVFSFSKTSDYADIIYPAWTFWEGGPAIPIYPRGVGRWDLMRKSLIAAAKKYPWETKESKVFFRGSRTSPERDFLIYLSRKEPSLVDAQYTKNQAWKSDADTLYSPAAAEVELEEHCKYKYLFNYRGVAASFRFKHLFLCKSLVFHVGEEWIEFFYPRLKPWIHYIPVTKNAQEAELRSLIEFAKEHDTLARKIAERGYNFIKTHLKMEHISCYWEKLLLNYSKLLKYKVERREDLILIG